MMLPVVGVNQPREEQSTLQVWLSLGSHMSKEPPPMLGIYVGAGNSPVSNKLAEQIRQWELVRMVTEVRLGEGESEGKCC